MYEINTKIINHITGPKLTLKDLCRLNYYIGSGMHVVVLIAARMLKLGSGAPTKNHWIVWNDKLKLLNGQEITEHSILTEQVQLELFSWGNVSDQLKFGTTLADVMRYSFAALMVNKIP